MWPWAAYWTTAVRIQIPILPPCVRVRVWNTSIALEHNVLAMYGRSVCPHNLFVELLVGLEFALNVVGRISSTWACAATAERWTTREPEYNKPLSAPRPALRSAQTSVKRVPSLVWRGKMLTIRAHPRPYVFVAWCLIKSKDNFTFTFIIHSLHKLQSELLLNFSKTARNQYTT